MYLFKNGINGDAKSFNTDKISVSAMDAILMPIIQKMCENIGLTEENYKIMFEHEGKKEYLTGAQNIPLNEEHMIYMSLCTDCGYEIYFADESYYEKFEEYFQGVAAKCKAKEMKKYILKYTTSGFCCDFCYMIVAESLEEAKKLWNQYLCENNSVQYTWSKAQKAMKYHHDGFITWTEAGYSDNQKGCYELQKNYHNERSDHLQD